MLFAAIIFISSLYSVQCNLFCFNSKMNMCRLHQMFEGRKEFCGRYSETNECLSKAAEECSVKDSPQYEAITSFYSHLCNDESSLAKEYDKDSTCAKNALNPEACMQEHSAEVQELHRKLSSSDAGEILLAGCRLEYLMNDCLRRSVMTKCGGDSLKLYDLNTETINKLKRQVCLDQGFKYPTDSQLGSEGTKSGSVRLASDYYVSWLLFIAAFIVSC